MNSDTNTGIGFMEGRTYTIGRAGHIRIDDPSVSRGHAEIRFIDGKIRLRDLSSTNGTFLVKGNELVHFEEGPVNPNQRLVLGSRPHTVKGLLAIVGIFATYSEQNGLSIKLSRPSKKSSHG
jgi:pSer/pThr/pTyr-binding forkhead associated (FHA) protein